MDPHPTPFPANKGQSVKSKYKKISEAPKQKIKEAPTQTQTQRHRRTFGTIRNPNVPEKTVSDNPKAKAPNYISIKQPKTERHIAPPIPNTESGKKTSQNGSSDRTNARKKKSVSFPEKSGEADGVKTPARPPFSVKPVRIPGTPYLSAEKCSGCRFDRLETASYWLAQIKSSESVGKHFVSVAFFRLAHNCRAEPVKNLEKELKNYLSRHGHLSSKAEWKDVSRMYGIRKEEHETKRNDSKLVDTMIVASRTN